MSRLTVLGVDLASASWADVGAALIECDSATGTFETVIPGAISWPKTDLSPATLAAAIDECARDKRVAAVALDGPQGWRDPATDAARPGVGRRCEYECRTQGKTGVRPRAYPGTQQPWIQFSIEVFDHLLAQPGVVLADIEPHERSSYAVLECFPTSAWRSSGLAALPAKRKKPELASYRDRLRDAYRLPPFDVASHDDLQAVVAALCAIAAAGGPAQAMPKGEKARYVGDTRVEGLIWDVCPTHPPGVGALP